MKILLKSPIKRDNQTISEIALREPSAGELRGIKLLDLMQGETSALMELLPRISQPVLTKAEAHALSLKDLAQVMNALGEMLIDDELGKLSPSV